MLTSFLKRLNYTMQFSDQFLFIDPTRFSRFPPLFARIYPRLPFSFRFALLFHPFFLSFLLVPLSFSLCVSSPFCSPSAPYCFPSVVPDPDAERCCNETGYHRTENRRSFVNQRKLETITEWNRTSKSIPRS